MGNGVRLWAAGKPWKTSQLTLHAGGVWVQGWAAAGSRPGLLTLVCYQAEDQEVDSHYTPAGMLTGCEVDWKLPAGRVRRGNKGKRQKWSFLQWCQPKCQTPAGVTISIGRPVWCISGLSILVWGCTTHLLKIHYTIKRTVRTFQKHT